jgi:aminotransferase
MVDISEFGYESDYDFAVKLCEKVGVGGVPGSVFFNESVNHLIRFHFAKEDSTLNDALNKLENIKVLKK